jgi:type I restriction enzyme S subunit
VKNGWDAYPLTDERVFSFRNGLWKGKTPPFVPVGVLRSTNFRNDGILDYLDVALLDVEQRAFEKRRLVNGDIIIERSGGGPTQPVGRVAFFDRSDGKFSFSNFTSSLRIENKSLFFPKFVHYFLLDFHWRGETEKLQNRTTGIRNLDFTNYKKVGIPCPPLPEQRKIAAVLAKIQRAVELQETILANLRELKKSMMNRLFTHGLRGEKLKQTEIGRMPQSWRAVRVDSVANISSGGTPDRSVEEYWNSGTIPWVKTAEVDYRVIQETQEKITEAGLNNSAARLYPKGTLLVAMYGQGVTRGRVGILGIEASTNQACAALTPKTDVEMPFLFCYLTHNYERLRALGHGANQRNLNSQLIGQFLIPKPAINEQREITEILQTLDEKFAVHESKKSALQDLFKATLSQLMTAAVRVADLDIDTSEVAGGNTRAITNIGGTRA